MTDISLSDILIDVATSSAVDVGTQRTVNPNLRAVGQAYRVYSVIKPAIDIAQAFRIVAYSDVAGILANEIIVHIASQKLNKAFGSLDTINYAVHRNVERFLFDPDFSHPVMVDTDILTLYRLSTNSNFILREYHEMGKPLLELGYDCIVRGIRAHSVVEDLLKYPESLKQRGYQNWNRQKNIIDKINEISGFVLWRPIPDIGLGTSRISNISQYSGIFRRDQAEGYGRISHKDGVHWFGQVRDGWPVDYGVFEFSDGRIFVGYVPGFKSIRPNLGVSISSKKDRLIFGAHNDTGQPDGYARQIGIKNEVDSYSGMWTRGELIGGPLEFEAEVFKTIAAKKDIRQFAELHAEYQKKANLAEKIQLSNDCKIIELVNAFL